MNNRNSKFSVGADVPIKPNEEEISDAVVVDADRFEELIRSETELAVLCGVYKGFYPNDDIDEDEVILQVLGAEVILQVLGAISDLRDSRGAYSAVHNDEPF